LYVPGLDLLSDASRTLTPELGPGFAFALTLNIVNAGLAKILHPVLGNLTVTKYGGPSLNDVLLG
jgi:hypothetical protein